MFLQFFMTSLGSLNFDPITKKNLVKIAQKNCQMVVEYNLLNW